MHYISMRLFPILQPYGAIHIVNLNQIPKNQYMVYILEWDEKAVVNGHGEYNRAQVIFNDINFITVYHIKSLFVRLYHLFGNRPNTFFRYIIPCQNKEEANRIEFELHDIIGGNNRDLPDYIKQALDGAAPSQLTRTFLKLAVASGYSGLSDLKTWRKQGIILDQEWNEILNILQLPQDF